MQDAFGIKQFVMVGDRGMLTQKQIDVIDDIDGVDWIGALRPEAIKKLITNGAIQMGIFDERNLFEIKHPDFPGERLIACRNAELAHKRATKRDSLLKATVKELDKVRGMVWRGPVKRKKRDWRTGARNTEKVQNRKNLPTRYPRWWVQLQSQ